MSTCLGFSAIDVLGMEGYDDGKKDVWIWYSASRRVLISKLYMILQLPVHVILF